MIESRVPTLRSGGRRTRNGEREPTAGVIGPAAVATGPAATAARLLQTVPVAADRLLRGIHNASARLLGSVRAAARLPRTIGVIPALLLGSAVHGASLVRTVTLDRVGLNMSLAAEANGDLHLAWRGGAGNNPSNYSEIRYLHYTASNDTWHFPSLLVVNDTSAGRVAVSPDIDTNQPRIAIDPSTPGRAYIIFAGDFRNDLQPRLARIEPSSDGRGQVAGITQLGQPDAEIRGVDVAVASDASVYACLTRTDTSGNASSNGIYCFRGAPGGSGFVRERATRQQASGEGISVVAAPGLPVRAAGSFGANQNNGAYSRRDGVSAGAWTPGPQLFDIPFAAGKVRLQPPVGSSDGLFTMASILASSNDLSFFGLSNGTPTSGPARLQRFVYLGPAVVSQGGDLFSSEDLATARSAAGRTAVAYGIDGTIFLNGIPPTEGNDLGVILVAPPSVGWPPQFEDGEDEDHLCLCGEPACGTEPPDCDPKLDGCDIGCDGLNDLIGGTASLDQLRFGRASFPYFGTGSEGRLVIAFDAAETMAIAFSGEDLWTAYYDGTVKQARVSRLRVVPEAPELGPTAIAVILGIFAPLLFGIRRAREMGTS